jgi:hypothetical protein
MLSTVIPEELEGIPEESRIVSSLSREMIGQS